MKVAVVGAGAWGTTVASTLASRAETVIWARKPEVVAAINEGHENALFLPGARLSPSLRASLDPAEAVAGAGIVALAVPSEFYREVLGEVGSAIAPDVPCLSLSKGIEVGSLKRMTEVAAEVLS